MDDVSCKGIGAYEEFAGGNLTVPGGYYKLIELLLEDINDLCDNNRKSFQAHKSCKVVKVEWPGTAVDDTQPNSIREDSTVKITCDNGSIFESAHLIVTFPLGVLKKSAELFLPPLPEYKQAVISRMGFGTVDKIFLEYSSRSVISGIFTDSQGVHTDEMMLLWGEAEVKSGKWYSKIFSIYRISDHCIQLWVTGLEAEQLEGMSPQVVNSEVTGQLRRFFADGAFPLADNVIITRWGEDEFTLGSYSYISVGSSQEDITKLAMPVYRRSSDAKVSVVFLLPNCNFFINLYI